MGKVVHFEIPFEDQDRAEQFYTRAFGWSFQHWGEDTGYLLTDIQDGEMGINGALISRSELHAAPVVIIDVEDIDAGVAAAVTAGAEQLGDKNAVPNMGWSAYVRDPEGNVIGLWQSDEQAG